MQIKPEQLEKQLNSSPPLFIWISGDEPLLLQECADIVRSYARDAGFSEREVFDIQAGFDWGQVLGAANSMSLFADRKLIELRLQSAKLDNPAKEALQSYLQSPSPDNLMLLQTPKVEKASQNTKWFKALEKQGFFVQVWPVSAQQMPGWIQQRLRRAGFNADPQAIQVLTQRVEGNLLAAAQEIEKLRMLLNVTELDGETVARAVADSARFNVFALIDACLSGNTARSIRILSHLRAEGAEVLQLLNMLCREIRALSRMRGQIDSGQHINGVMQAERVWSSRTALVSSALKKHGIASLESMLEQAQSVDFAVKGLNDQDAWDGLLALVTQLCMGQRAAA